ncbi:MAG: carbohydrate-binding protein [Verrucomicrobiota bacterium JB025]|nr:LamG-like jellyroll fold domain-containing protein [Verrucomicrobiota bacterium JB025]
MALLCSAAWSQTVVSSFTELIPYLDDDNVEVVMTPGTYRITPDDVTSGLFPSNPDDPHQATLLTFTGSGSTFDFTGVTIEVDTRVFQSFGNIDVKEVAVWGDDLVLKNLTLTDIGNTRPRRTALGVLLDGSRNRIEGFTMTVRGSYPYGYGDIFGKGSDYVIKHFKHSAILVRGTENHLLNCNIFHRAYGHGIFCQGSLDARIEGCYLEGEVRTTDEVLAELGTGSGADGVNFETVWALDPVNDPDGVGFTLPPGSTFSLQEDGIRAYNTGPGLDGVTRNTRNMEVIDCTIKYMRSGVTIGFCDNTKYVENCVSIGCENGYWVGSEGEIVNSAGTAEFGPLLTTSYQNDRDTVVDLTILTSELPHTNNMLAYLAGSGHDITFRSSEPSVDPDLKIMVTGLKEGHRWLTLNPTYNDFTSNNITLNNLTNYRVVMDSKSENTSGQSAGPVTDNGTNNNLTSTSLRSCGGVAALQSIEAEDYCGQSGVSTQPTADGGQAVGSIEAGDWLRFDDFFFGSGPSRFEARATGGTNGGTIELRLNALDGPLIGSCPVGPGTTGDQWVTETADLLKTTGKHDLFLIFTGNSGELMALDSFKLVHWLEDSDDRDGEHLMAHWKLDDAAGTTALDSSGRGHDATVTNVDWTTGLKNGALEFTGTDQQVELPAAAFDSIENEITLSMFVRGSAGQPLADSVFYATNESGDRVFNIHLPYDDGHIYWDAGNSGGSQRIDRAATEDQFKDTWNHWAFVKNTTEGTMKAYHNGVLFMAGLGMSNTMSGVTSAVLGTRPGNDSYDGLIDDVKLYNVAFTEMDVERLYLQSTSNASPVAIPATVRVRLDQSLDLTLEATDDDDDPLNFTLIAGPSHGTLQGTAPNLTYLPDPGFLGSDSVTFRVDDGELDSPAATIDIDVWQGSLIAHWALDETNGSALADSSGNGHDATLVGGTPVGGKLGGAIDFDGVDDAVSLPVSAFAGLTDEITLSMWVYGADSQPREDSIFHAIDDGGDRMLNIHLPWTGSKVYWDAGFDSGYDRIWKVAEPSDFMGQWNHWIFSKNASTGIMTIHLNGALFHTGSSKDKSLAGIVAASLGSQVSPAGFANNYAGMIDEVMLFDYAVTDSEAADLNESYTVQPAIVIWLDSFPALADTSWAGDPDGDGMATGLEYVLDGNPDLADPEILPVASVSDTHFIFSFTRRAESADDTIQSFQYAETLTGEWTDLSITAPSAAEVSIGPVVDGLQTVTVSVSRSLATADRLFGRLVVVNP